MGWIILATTAQFLSAIVALFDKYIVTDEKLLPKPFVYAFYSCLVTAGWVLVFFLGLIPGFSALGVPSFTEVQFPTIQVVGLSFLAAYTFFIALVSMYAALKRSDASSIIPLIGTVTILSSFALEHFFLGRALSDSYILGIVLLATGTFLVAQTLPRATVAVQTVHSGLFFGLHAITMKALFLETNFADGFFWSRIGFVLFVLSLLLVPSYFTKIKERTQQTTKKTGFLVLFAKLLAGVAAFLTLKATDLAEASVVQALGGLQFIFILFLGFVFHSYLPNSAVDSVDKKPKLFVRQFLYIIVITAGFFALLT